MKLASDTFAILNHSSVTLQGLQDDLGRALTNTVGNAAPAATRTSAVLGRPSIILCWLLAIVSWASVIVSRPFVIMSRPLVILGRPFVILSRRRRIPTTRTACRRPWLSLGVTVETREV